MENKILTDGTETDAEVQTVEVRKPRSEETRLALRTKKTGMFAKKPPKRMPTPIEVQNYTLKKLIESTNGEQSLWEQIIDNLAKNACASAESPVFDKLGNVIMVDGKPLTVKDAKAMMASAKSFDTLLKASLGTPKAEPVQQKISIVRIGFPTNMMNTEVSAYEDRPKSPTVPAFAEVTEIVTNEPTKE
jgi:hypothetical protein